MASPRVPGSRFEKLWRQAREPMFVLDGVCRLVGANTAWEELTGYPFDSVARLDCNRGATQQGDGPLEQLAAALSPPPEVLAGRPASVDMLIIHRDGNPQPRRIEFRSHSDVNGKRLFILGLILAAHDVSLVPEAESRKLHGELARLRRELVDRFGLDRLIGQGPRHLRLLAQIRAAARARVPVLVHGETGTGKRTVASVIHTLSDQAQAPFVTIDCAASSAEDAATAIFGDPNRPTDTRLAIGNEGTLVLHEVQELARELQLLLVKVCGKDQPGRVIATTSKDLATALKQDVVCKELYYMFTTFNIELASLRDRLEELPLLAQDLLERVIRRSARQRSGWSSAALEDLRSYDWPGNLGELARVAESAHARSETEMIQPGDLPAEIRGSLGGAYLPPASPFLAEPLDSFLGRVEQRLIEQALRRARHNKSKAADLLGISRPRLYRRMKDLGIPDLPETGS